MRRRQGLHFDFESFDTRVAGILRHRRNQLAVGELNLVVIAQEQR
jgi:hypothetical protein